MEKRGKNISDKVAPTPLASVSAPLYVNYLSVSRFVQLKAFRDVKVN